MSAFVILAKIIKQRPVQYIELNNIYLDVIQRYERNEI